MVGSHEPHSPVEREQIREIDRVVGGIRNLEELAVRELPDADEERC
jgi:hypothetical protein